MFVRLPKTRHVQLLKHTETTDREISALNIELAHIKIKLYVTPQSLHVSCLLSHEPQLKRGKSS